MEHFSRFLVALFLSSVVTRGESSRPKNESKLAFLAIGDFGGKAWPPYYTGTLKNVAKTMGKVARTKSARFVLGLGDNFYWNGVKNVNDFRFQSTFENVFNAPALHKTTWHMIAGNHDYLGNVLAQIAYTKVSRRWNFPNYYYTKVERIPGTCVTVQVVMIDTTLLCYKRTSERIAHYKWLEETLKNSSADYLVVAGHHPVYSAGVHGSTYCLQQKLRPLLWAYDVTAYLSGHDHNLQHIKEKNYDVHYFVSGSASNHNALQLHKGCLPCDSLRYFNGRIGAFALLEATPKSLKVTFISERGRVLYSADISPRQRECSASSPRDMIESFEDNILDAFFSLQYEQELKKQKAREKSQSELGDKLT